MSPPSAAGGAVQQLQQLEVADLAATGRMVEVAVDAEQLGAGALQDLAEQREQLDNVDRQMDKMRGKISEAGLTMTSMSTMKRCCLCLFFPYQQSHSGTHNVRTRGLHSASTQSLESASDHLVGSEGSEVQFRQITDSPVERMMKDNLNHVKKFVVNLREMAVAMGGEIDQQNQLLAAVNEKGQANQERLKGVREDAQNILNK